METKKLIEILKNRGYKLKGLDAEKISGIEAYFSISFPVDYFLFLKEMGLDGGGFLKGSDCFYDRIYDLRSYAEELLEEDNSNFKLKKEDFVFYSHQGYIFAFFDSSQENPPIYYYVEGALEPSIKHPSFASFLEENIQYL